MSNYRDDVNETVSLQDKTQNLMKGNSGETLLFSDRVRYTLKGRITDSQFYVADAVSESTRITRSEGVTLGDAQQHTARKRSFVTEYFHVNDVARWKARCQFSDGLILSDKTASGSLSGHSDGVMLSDVFVGQRRVRHDVTETFALTDGTARVRQDKVSDNFSVGEARTGRLKARQQVVEALALIEATQQEQSTASRVFDAFRIQDGVLGHLRAENRVTEEFALLDNLLPDDNSGQAWTANTSDWAMSRYTPFTFDHLSVIDGVVYGCNRHGVFAFNGASEIVNAEIHTGALDMGGDRLTKPLGAYVEYALTGTAEFDVTTTQHGTKQTFTYLLNARPVADNLTNARAPFGRGLRGRHFSYSIRMTATTGYLNDWGVIVTQSPRRI